MGRCCARMASNYANLPANRANDSSIDAEVIRIAPADDGFYRYVPEPTLVLQPVDGPPTSVKWQWVIERIREKERIANIDDESVTAHPSVPQDSTECGRSSGCHPVRRRMISKQAVLQVGGMLSDAGGGIWEWVLPEEHRR